MSRKIVQPCDFCSKAKPGWLWLGGADYVECPDCEATGKVECIEYRVKYKEQLLIIPGAGSLRRLSNQLVNWT